MTQAVMGKTLQEMDALFDSFQQIVTGEGQVDEDHELASMSGISQYPMRVKCATLCWHAVRSAVHGESDQVSTE